MSGSVFNDYAQFYDVFYRDKDYAGEARFVDELLRSAGAAGGTLLDLGCGTGGHARELARRGWRVSGVDRSAAMIARARRDGAEGEGIKYHVGTGAAFDLAHEFTAVVSLFHVASYHAGPGELEAMLRNVRRHLATGGVFVFDFWHGGGVRADPPTVRTREFRDGATRITRISRPRHDAAHRIIDVDYELTIEPGGGAPVQRIGESHRLRYFFLSELETALGSAGLRVEHTRGGVEDKALDETAWYGLIVARAI